MTLRGRYCGLGFQRGGVLSSVDLTCCSRASKKRVLDSSDGDPNEGFAYPDGESSSFDASNALNALGYMPHTHHLVLGRGNGPKVDYSWPAMLQGSR